MSLVIWAAVLFLSILVHELGHAFAMRHFGRPARIAFTMMGGLAIEDAGGGTWGGFRSAGKTRSSREQIIISLAGPIAGFLLAGLVIGALFAARGGVEIVRVHGEHIPFLNPILPPGLANSTRLHYFLFQLLWFNTFWGAVNLLPVYPLDGGQVARAWLVETDPWRGIERSLWLSVFAGAGMAIVGLVSMKQPFIAMLFGSMAFNSYQQIAQLGGRGRGGW